MKEKIIGYDESCKNCGYLGTCDDCKETEIRARILFTRYDSMIANGTLSLENVKKIFENKGYSMLVMQSAFNDLMERVEHIKTYGNTRLQGH